MIRVQAAGLSDTGKIRKANEDRFLLNPSLGLYVVADGMGGHRGGEVASQMAVEVIGTYLATPPADPPEVRGTDAVAASQRLRQGIVLANRTIFEQSTANEAYRGMGTTISALYLIGDTLITANVGDSPIYLVRKGTITDLYTPHTLLHEGSPKALSRYPSSSLAHILTRALGVRQTVRMDLTQTQCTRGDIVVICSDGLSGKATRTEINDIVRRESPAAACEILVDLANRRGGEDNITVIVAKLLPHGDGAITNFFQRVVSIPAGLASLLTGRKRT